MSEKDDRDEGRGAAGVAGKSADPIAPVEVRPSPAVLVVAAVFMITPVVALVTQRDTSGGYMTAFAVLVAVVAAALAIRTVVARIRLEPEGLVHTDIVGRRRLPLAEMDRAVILQPHGRGRRTRGYELIIRTTGGRKPWLLATGMFWDRQGLRRLGESLGAARSSAVSRTAVEKTYPGATSWLLRRTSTQWCIVIGAVLLIGLLLWQTR